MKNVFVLDASALIAFYLNPQCMVQKSLFLTFWVKNESCLRLHANIRSSSLTIQ